MRFFVQTPSEAHIWVRERENRTFCTDVAQRTRWTGGWMAFGPWPCTVVDALGVRDTDLAITITDHATPDLARTVFPAVMAREETVAPLEQDPNHREVRRWTRAIQLANRIRCRREPQPARRLREDSVCDDPLHRRHSYSDAAAWSDTESPSAESWYPIQARWRSRRIGSFTNRSPEGLAACACVIADEWRDI